MTPQRQEQDAVLRRLVQGHQPKEVKADLAQRTQRIVDRETRDEIQEYLGRRQ